MATRAAIVTKWVQSPGENKPSFGDDYTYETWSDVTGQDVSRIAPVPNEFTIVAEMSDDVFAALDTDPDYDVLWSEPVEVVNG